MKEWTRDDPLRMQFHEDGTLISYDRNGHVLTDLSGEEQYYLDPMRLRETRKSRRGEEPEKADAPARHEQTDTEETNKPLEKTAGAIHAGHRERMRDRFFREGFEGYQDHEVLEMMLYYGKARGDTNKLAHELMDQFGSLKAVLEASPEMLLNVKGVGESAAAMICMIVQLTRRYEALKRQDVRQITNRKDAESYCRSLVMGHRTERFHVICLSASCTILGQRRISEGSISEVNAYPRLVVETALNYNAHSVILCHNHPGGTETPSAEDISSTIQLQRVLGGIGIVLLDHIIVSDASAYSMVQHGDVTYRGRG